MGLTAVSHVISLGSESSRKTVCDMQPARIPRDIFKPHLVLGWSLTAAGRVHVPFRRNVAQHVGSDGYREVPGQVTSRDVVADLNLYGCSFTYGTGLADSETFASLLQTQHQDIRINNRGVPGYSSVQSYLSFESDVLNGDVQAAVFLLHPVHRIRNIPHPTRMRQFLSLDWHRAGIEHVPCCDLTSDGFSGIRYVPIWQPSLQGRPFDAFVPQEHVFERAMVQTCLAICRLAARNDIPIGFAMIDRFENAFAQQLSVLPNLIDISAPGPEYNFSPFDGHPNAKANRLFAERLDGMVTDLKSQMAG